ncbi:MAG: hypothetical protein FWF44_11405 [Defluviitaleaceae bacterium]|nr:hypothetical protein [Defluviitaleaceae bacterium]
MSKPGKGYDTLDSLEELIDSVKRGAEIEFHLHGVQMYIGTGVEGLCSYDVPVTTEQLFKDVKDMKENWRDGQGNRLVDIWQDIQIDMFYHV